jgi:hypothetical protein
MLSWGWGAPCLLRWSGQGTPDGRWTWSNLRLSGWQCLLNRGYLMVLRRRPVFGECLTIRKYVFQFSPIFSNHARWNSPPPPISLQPSTSWWFQNKQDL